MSLAKMAFDKLLYEVKPLNFWEKKTKKPKVAIVDFWSLKWLKLPPLALKQIKTVISWHPIDVE